MRFSLDHKIFARRFLSPSPFCKLCCYDHTYCISSQILQRRLKIMDTSCVQFFQFFNELFIHPCLSRLYWSDYSVSQLPSNKVQRVFPMMLGTSIHYIPSQYKQIRLCQGSANYGPRLQSFRSSYDVTNFSINRLYLFHRKLENRFNFILFLLTLSTLQIFTRIKKYCTYSV